MFIPVFLNSLADILLLDEGRHPPLVHAKGERDVFTLVVGCMFKGRVKEVIPGGESRRKFLFCLILPETPDRIFSST